MATISQTAVAITDTLPLWRISTAKYLQMIEAGFLGPKDRVELIEGVIVPMSPQGPRHNSCVMRLNELFSPLFKTALVAIQATVTISEGAVFDPDVLLLRRDPAHYKTRHPGAADILLVVEAADSSLPRDLSAKMPIYAEAGIQEYWIVDLEHEAVIVHREPVGAMYRVVETKRGDDVVAPLAAPDFSITARQLLG